MVTINKKRGFTLIEVIGVIIVLSVIALITVPVVTKVMNDSRKNSFKVSAENLVEAANNYYADNQLSIDKTLTFNFASGGKTDTGIKLAYKGVVPTGGRLVLNADGGVALIDINNGKYYANYDSTGDDKIIVTETNEVLTRDELTQAIKDIKKALDVKNTEVKDIKKELLTKDTEVKEIKKELLAKDTEIGKLKDANKTKLNANDLLNKTYPVGSIYVSISRTNPNSTFGGTWVAYGSGRTLVGVDTNQGEFNAVEKTGGEKAHVLSEGELAYHRHYNSYWTDGNGNHRHKGLSWMGQENEGRSITLNSGSSTWGYSLAYSGKVRGNESTNIWTYEGGSHQHSINQWSNYNGSNLAHNNLQPYITVYMWKRTA